MDDVVSTPPRRRSGIWWIVASSVLLPGGWVAWLLVALAGNSARSLAAQTTGSIVVTVVCVGLPLAAVGLLLVQRRRDPSVTLVGPVTCAVIAVLAAVTLGYPTVGVAKHWAADAERRAQPLTALETSRSEAQAEQDVADLGERAVRALGEDPSAGDVRRFPRACPLSNLAQGTKCTWRWTMQPASDDEDEPQTQADRTADLLPQDEVGRRLAPVREVFRDAGLRDAEPLGWDIRATGDDRIEEGNASVTRTTADVMVETLCFARGPGDGEVEEE